MRKLFFLVLICISVIETQAQTYTSGLTATGSGSATNVRLGGANPLLVNTTVDLGTSFTFGFKKSTANYFTVLNNGNIGIGTITPTSLLHLKAGTTTLNTAPLKFTSGVNLTTPEAGAMEFNGTSLFFTPSTLRKTIAFADLSNITGLLPATLGGTGLASFATGDMLYASAANVLSKRTIGTTGQVLTVLSGVPAWVTPAAGVSGWGLSGNAGTVAGTNFIGTTDNADVVFKRNGVNSGLINTNNTGFGVNNLALNTTGINNTATGAGAAPAPGRPAIPQ